MLKQIYTTLEKLETYDEFKEFKKNHPDAYLVSAFFMAEEKDLDKADWQVDFYSPKKHKISSFVLADNSLNVKAGQEVFQKDKETLKELKLEDVKIDFDGAIKEIEKIKTEKYPSETTNKVIVLLQIIHDECLWNVTYLMNSFNVWNIKIDAVDGDVKSEKMQSIISFKKKPQ